MSQAIVGKQNNLAYTWSVTAGVGTLTISGCVYFDLTQNMLLRVEDTTLGTVFGLTPNTTFSNTFVAGLPIFTWVITPLPTGTLTADVLLVYLSLQPDQINSLLLQYQKA